MYNNSKYSKFLTIALIVVVVIIVGLLIFWGVDSIVKYNVNNDSQQGIEAFKNQTQTGGNADLILPTGNTVTGTNSVVVDPYANMVVIPDDNSASTGGSTSKSDNGEILYQGYPMMGYIEITKTNIKYPVLKEATKEAMEKSVCILVGPGLNKPGVTVISGHNYRNGLFFSNNAKLSTGDKIYITDNNGKTVTYEIYKKYQTTPEDASFASVDTEGRREIVLTTCTDNSQNRIIICAREA